MEGLYISIAAVLMTTPAATCTWMHRQLEQQWKLMVRKGLWINSLCRIGVCRPDIAGDAGDADDEGPYFERKLSFI
jgi:hypothetical protein